MLPSTPVTSPFRTTRRQLLLGGLVALLGSQSGCGAMAQMMYWARGNPVDAKFPGLKKKTVAVVCFDGNLAGQGSEADMIAKRVTTMLDMNVEKIKIVSQQKVLDWMDGQTENVNDFKEVGRGVKAEMVVGIDIDKFSTHEGPGLLRGRSRYSVKVFDMTEGGKLVYSVQTTPVIFPEMGPRAVTEGEEMFKMQFIDIVAKKIAKDFYPYDKMEDFGNDAADFARQ
ncbi:hypothetical protein [Anatilimnocola floriformis]|uniref:hypothetical protein n=1 Tax=Anatilimnocola floriformis TaxID=2948575 RepID=UPI0020C5923D|nr:hypothetical protein [Anatilimnocola floriformis]